MAALALLAAVVCVFLVDKFLKLPVVRAFQTTRTKPFSDRKTLAILEHHRHERLLRDDNCIVKGSTRYCTELAASMDTTKSTVEETTTTMRSYQYDGWNLTYRTNSQNEKSTSTSSNTDVHKVLLIHPVGVGIASWFWEPLMESLSNNDSGETKIKAYAPNLIGCGLSEGSDAWDPNKRGMFVPLSWVKGCEALMRQLDDDEYDKQLQEDGDGESRQQPWTVVTQGGLAPIGVLLASRNPTLINKLVLTSPPTWKDMVTAVPEANLKRNYLFFTGPIVSDLAFAILETRFLIRFFSDQFLFDQSCDEKWLDKTSEEMCVAARPPVAAFNAGFCLQRSLEPELTSFLQNVWVVQGQGDKRDREGYSQNIPSCETITLPRAANVLPWEIPEATADLLKKIVRGRS